ncbi:hypothetical protein C8A03DRAFT_33599 [Achaetomium macrosporum]|uniref:RBR-type E3 ubiquitin transferase n=1 Tax=Achaetomium macrosporum TaxID=79813 RepID=A0AAN7CBL2_9PEZI|nr:hypothetical protein C8A03DRAFT_33599 [Achaetomium macrosporum]
MASTAVPHTNAFYGPTNPAILGSFEWEEDAIFILAAIRPEPGESETTGQSTGETALQRNDGTERVVPSRPGNPYATAIEDKHNAMTAAFLRSRERPTSTGNSQSLAPDDLCFGQRYQVRQETSSVVVTRQRRLPDVLSGDRECVVCTDTKSISEFPVTAITRACNHEPMTCLVCVATSIRADLNNRLWNEIRCPECGETLEYDDVQRFADDGTKERYQTLSFRAALSSSPTFLWCTAGCGYGQVHEGGVEQPIVTCRVCSCRSCFHHKVAWHETLTCEEYDALMADPVNFRRAKEQLRRKKEEEASQKTVTATTKPCPGLRI